MPSADPNAPQPLGLTIHSLPAPGDVLDRQRASGRLKMLLVLLVCAAPVLASYFTFYVLRPTGDAYSQLIQPPVPMPPLVARGLDGQPLPLRSLRGQWLLVVVGGGACDVACEQRLFLQRQLREMMGAERDRIRKVWLVDSPGPLAPDVAAAVAATPAVTAYRVERTALARWLEPEAGHALEDHLYIVDPLGHWMMRTPADPDPARLKRDVDRLLRASAWWNRPRDAR